VDFTEEAIRKLQTYPYPGNVRELKAVIELAIILSDNSKIEAKNINFIPVVTHEEFSTTELPLNEQILIIVRNNLMKYNSNPTIVAKKLGISRATVYRYIKEMDL
jgi:two-component system, NtrC family, response regulator AtoC